MNEFKRLFTRLSRLSAEFGLVSGPLLYLRNKYGIGSDFGALDSVAWRGHKVFLRKKTSDIVVLLDVLCERQYDIKPVEADPRFIIDAGANVGYASIYFANRFPKATILALEPESSNFELLMKNASSFANIIPLKAGLWYKRTQLSLADPGAEKWAFQLVEGNGGIDVFTVSDLMKEYGANHVDLLKIDIEGSEFEIFSNPSYKEWITKTSQIIVELHDRFKPGASSALASAIADYPHDRIEKREDTVINFTIS